MRSLVVMLVVGAGSSCIDRMILDGTLQSTRDAASTFDTLSDLEVAKTGAASSLVQLEGMQKLAPDNANALFLLLQGWTGYASAFIEDQWEQAVDKGDDVEEAYQSNRAREAYTRAIGFGAQLLEQKRTGFQAAMRNHQSMTAYLSAFTKAEAETLLWLGAAWLSRASVAAERPELIAELFVGVALLERSVALDDTLAYGLGHAALGAYHARSPDAELAMAKAEFEKALTLTQRAALTTQLMYAQTYACNSRDAAMYTSLLNEVLSAGEVLPAQTLENRVAQRKAERYLKPVRKARCGF